MEVAQKLVEASGFGDVAEVPGAKENEVLLLPDNHVVTRNSWGHQQCSTHDSSDGSIPGTVDGLFRP